VYRRILVSLFAHFNLYEDPIKISKNISEFRKDYVFFILIFIKSSRANMSSKSASYLAIPKIL
jgi:hypothetical protein